jgi:hypothetical protein
MLTLNQITEVEGVYLAITSCGIRNELTIAFIEHFYKHNLYQFIYLKWLLQRWTLIKKHKHHLPKRFIHIANSLS